jgi:hypothetical protein
LASTFDGKLFLRGFARFFTKENAWSAIYWVQFDPGNFTNYCPSKRESGVHSFFHLRTDEPRKVARQLARKCQRHVEDRQRFTFFSAVVAESALTLLLLRLRQVISAQPSS